MTLLDVKSFAAGQWISPDASARTFENAVTGEVMGRAGNDNLDVAAMLDHARVKGGAALRAMTFHDRARMLKALALHLKNHKQALYDLSFATGATQSDTMIDVDGGITTMLVYQRVQLPRLGHVGKAGPDPLGGCASHRKTCDSDLLCH